MDQRQKNERQNKDNTLNFKQWKRNNDVSYIISIAIANLLASNKYG